MRDFAASPLISKITSEAMSSEKAMVRLKSVRSQLLDMVARKQFNTARAGNAFSTAIHWAVWENVKDRPNGRALYRDFKRSRLTASMAEELSAEFKQEVGTVRRQHSSDK